VSPKRDEAIKCNCIASAYRPYGTIGTGEAEMSQEFDTGFTMGSSVPSPVSAPAMPLQNWTVYPMQFDPR
jgi:hypothetical protein